MSHFPLKDKETPAFGEKVPQIDEKPPKTNKLDLYFVTVVVVLFVIVSKTVFG
jgi:hypothetical protein